jgi:hypothetical protein
LAVPRVDTMKNNVLIGVTAVITAGIAAGVYVVATRGKPQTTVTVVPPAPKPILSRPLEFLGLTPKAPNQDPTAPAVAVTGATQAQANAAAVTSIQANQAVNVAPPGVTYQTSTSQAVLEAQAAQAQAAQAAAEAARLEAIRQGEINNYRMTIAAVENDQVLTLSQIKAQEQDYNARIQQIAGDNSRLNDYISEATNELMSGSEWEKRVRDCKDAVARNCGFDLFGACNGANQPVCADRNPNFSWGNPAAAVWNEVRDPNNPRGGQARLTAWKQQQRDALEQQYKANRSPLEAQLARLEVQYKGLVRELSVKYGVTFNSTRPEVHL